MTGAVINHLWQSTVFAILAGLLTLAFRKNRAQVRYWLWFSASLKFLLPFSLLLTMGGYLGRSRPATGSVAVPAITYTVVQIAEPFPPSPAPAPSTRSNTDWIPIVVVGLWVCGFAGIALMRLRGGLRIRAVVRSSTPIDIPFPVEVHSSPALLEPGVVGFFRPVLLCPRGIVGRLTPSQWQAVLAHERCHIKRHDNLTAAIHMLVEAVFWFHPLVWWISARLIDERERACDEAVLELGSEPRVYAESILKTCEFCVESPVACVSGITGADLKKRIVRIMTQLTPSKLNLGKRIMLASIAMAAVAGPVVFGLLNAQQIRAQSASSTVGPLPSFEVASVKPNHSGSHGGRLDIPEGRFLATNLPAKMIIAWAYAGTSLPLRLDQLQGAPSWIDSERYDIDAKLDDSDVEALRKLPAEQRLLQIRLRLQSLLADRFKLRVRNETKELSIYALVIAKKGPRLQEAKPGDTYPNGMKGVDGRPILGKMWVGQGQNGEFFLKGQAVSMATFVTTMAHSNHVGHTVLDETGLKGTYDITLEWTPDQSPDGMIQGPDGGKLGAESASPPDTSGPSLFTAIREQLGLQLEPTKGPVDVIVIDHIERPSEN